VPVELRERKKALLRDTIVRNAIELFDQRGFDSVSVEEIVQVSLCSRSTFHRYFGTKEDLVFPTANDRLAVLEATLDSVDPADDPWAAAREAVSTALCGFVDDLEPDAKAACIKLWVNESMPRRRYLEIVLEWETVLLRFFGRRMGVEPVRSLECQLLASSVSSALRAALGTAMETDGRVDELISRAFDLIEAGLSAYLDELRTSTG
jgi:AcrR family transcriptional regulator